MFINKNNGTYTNKLYILTSRTFLFQWNILFGGWHASCPWTHVKSLYYIWIDTVYNGIWLLYIDIQIRIIVTMNYIVCLTV